MTSATSGRPGNKSENSSPTLDLSPQELRKYLSQPVRAIFHEQAKSILAIQVRGSVTYITKYSALNQSSENNTWKGCKMYFNMVPNKNG